MTVVDRWVPADAHHPRTADTLIRMLSDEPIEFDVSPALSWKVSQDAAWVGDDARAVVLLLTEEQGPQPLALEGTAAVIWQVLVESDGLSLQQLTVEVAGLFGVQADEIESDVLGLLRSLADREVVVVD